MRLRRWFVGGLVLVVGGCTAPDPATFNCGRFDSDDWRAPEGCVCTGPFGEATWVTPAGVEEPISCEDVRLQACPSTSGVGCSLAFVDQEPERDAGVLDVGRVRLHVDIGGHLHDLCCAQHYSLPDGAGFSSSCNGCTGQDPAGTTECDNHSVSGSVLGLPTDPAMPCSVEWAYATTALFEADVRWYTVFDTRLRWSGAQVVARNLGPGVERYTRPDGAGGFRPRFGEALRPSAFDGVDHRAASGTSLGPEALSLPFEEGTSHLGLDERQIGSFCVGEGAFFDRVRGAWVCR